MSKVKVIYAIYLKWSFRKVYIHVYMRGSKIFQRVCVCVGGGGLDNGFFCQECISQRAVWTSLEKQLDLRGPIAFRGVSVPEFIRKPIATCDFPGVGRSPVPHQ